MPEEHINTMQANLSATLDLLRADMASMREDNAKRDKYNTRWQITPFRRESFFS